jgi:hypothetical protein
VEDTEPMLLGKYTYQQNGTSLQHFSVQASKMYVISADHDIWPENALKLNTDCGNVEHSTLNLRNAVNSNN